MKEVCYGRSHDCGWAVIGVDERKLEPSHYDRFVHRKGHHALSVDPHELLHQVCGPLRGVDRPGRERLVQPYRVVCFFFVAKGGGG